MPQNTESFHFSGSDYSPELDKERLTGQLKAIKTLIADGKWYTLAEISHQTGAGEASVSAQLRNLRKPEFGGYTIEKQRRGESGLFEYRLVIMPLANIKLKEVNGQVEF